MSEFQYLLSQPGLETNIYGKVMFVVHNNYIIATLDLHLNIQDGTSLLWSASLHGRTDVIQLFLDHGAEVDLPDDVIYYKISLCSAHDHITLHTTLQDQWGETALMGACIKEQVSTAALLIEKGANVNYITKVWRLLYCILV